MAKAFGKDPTANLFTLLPPDEGDSAPKPEKTKKAKKAVVEVESKPVQSNVALTPAAKAAARKAKEEKAKKAAATHETKEEKQPAKLNREQWEQQNKKSNRKGKESEVATDYQYAHGTRPNLPPRQQVQGGEFGGRGYRGRRGRRGGRVEWSNRPEENKNREVYYRGQNLSEGKQGTRGREYDRKSGMKTGMNPYPKRRGGGRGNWGNENPTPNTSNTTWEAENTETPLENFVVQDDAPLESVVQGDWDQPDANETVTTTTTTTTTTTAPTEGGEQQTEDVSEEKVKLLDDFLEERKKNAAELAARLNRNVEPRKVVLEEGVVLKESNKKELNVPISKPVEEKTSKKKDKTPKFLPVDEVFKVRLPHPNSRRTRRWGEEDTEPRPQPREDRPRGNGSRRGGRGGGRQSRSNGGRGNRQAFDRDQDFPSLGST